MLDKKLDAKQLITSLGLEENPEGGWYRLIYAADPIPVDGQRPLMTVIHYLLTQHSPRAYLHRMSADAVHFFHAGEPMIVHTVAPTGEYRRQVLGSDLALGHQLQITVPGKCWKALELQSGNYSLISEAVVPGWVEQEQETARLDQFAAQHPQLISKLATFIRGAA